MKNKLDFNQDFLVFFLFCRWVLPCSGAEVPYPPTAVETDGITCLFIDQFGVRTQIECTHSTTTTKTTTTTTTTRTPSPSKEEGGISLDMQLLVGGILVAVGIVLLAVVNLCFFKKRCIFIAIMLPAGHPLNYWSGAINSSGIEKPADAFVIKQCKPTDQICTRG
ncbi:hypothetical protein niasHS_018049 [Heterodera schachtii]|uniref:Uncharacterized protein n=1 Tax=Heterodera schachtii TaxID=97005 RepID=A0ABD2HQ89_HETSC